jgi:hypothetical protein
MISLGGRFRSRSNAAQVALMAYTHRRGINASLFALMASP